MPLLHANSFGSGEDLIILHGFLGTGDNWKTLGKAYADAGFRVHLLDQRNHGRSFHSAQFTQALMAEDVLAYLSEQGIEKANVLGHSMGGKTAMYLAGIASEKVQKLLVADIGPKAYPPHHKTILDALNILYNTPLNSRSQAEEILSAHIKSPGIRQFLLKNLYRKTPDTFGFRANIPVLSGAMNAIGEPLPSEFNFTQPSMFLSGAQSDYILPEDHLSILVQFPKAQFKSISNAGHWLHAENPKDFLADTLAFLRV
tara:strand:+ start:1831 stop:2601 length:771 start_codon:yes stop_codon:yes gene_type:complete